MSTLAIDDIYLLQQSIQRIYAIWRLDEFVVQAIEILDRLVPCDINPLDRDSCDRQFRLKSVGRIERSGQISTPKLPFARPNEDPNSIGCPEVVESYRLLDDAKNSIVFFLADFDYQAIVKPDRTAITDTTMPLGISMHRDRGVFNERDRLLLDLFYPHLFQAYTNAFHHQQSRQETIDLLNLIAVDREGRISQISPRARIWLMDYFNADPTAEYLPDRLHSWLQSRVVEGTSFPLSLRIQLGNRILKISAIEARAEAKYLLRLEESEFLLQASLELLGLSQRESEVLVCVIQGKDNNQIADILSVRPTTVRKHLENIYEKLAVKSRTEAVYQALAKIGYLDGF